MVAIIKPLFMTRLDSVPPLYEKVINIKATTFFLDLFGDRDSSETKTKMIHFSHIVYILHIS